jgi:hypothetical protein
LYIYIVIALPIKIEGNEGMETTKSAMDLLVEQSQAHTEQTNQVQQVTPALTQEATPGSEINNVEDSVQETDKVAKPQETEVEIKNEIEDWDLEKQPAKVEPSKDLEELSKALNLPFNDPVHIINEVKNLKTTNSELEKQIAASKTQEQFANEDIKKANEIAKNGGDYREYLGLAESEKNFNVDYNAIPDKTLLVESELRSLFPNTPEGQRELEMYLEGLSDVDLRVRASKIRQDLNAWQNTEKGRITTEKLRIETAVNEKKKAEDASLRKELDQLTSIGDFKIKPEHRREIYESFTENKVIGELFYNDKKQFDAKKAIETYAKVKFYDKHIAYLKSKSKVEGRKEVINSATNINLNKTSAFASPEVKSSHPLDQAREALRNK